MYVGKVGRYAKVKFGIDQRLDVGLYMCVGGGP